MTFRLRRAHTFGSVPNVAVDTALVGLVGTIAVVATLGQDVTAGLRVPNLMDATLAFATAIPLLFRRRFPITATAVTCVLAWILVASRAPEGAVPFVVLGVLFNAGSSVRLGRSLWALAAAVATLVALVVVDTPGLTPGEAVLFGAVYGLVWVTAVGARDRRRALERATRRTLELEAEHAQRELAEQQLAIARDLHDVLAHSISVIAVQAGVALHFLDRDPVQTREALTAVSATSRFTLDELRQIVGVLRNDGQAATGSPPSLGDVSALVDRVHALGVPVRLRIEGPIGEVAARVGGAVYRLVQEALTNTIKHAGHVTDVSVDIHCQSDSLTVAITDDGLGVASVDSDARQTGYGLSGMRERVHRIGGVIAAGSLEPRGYSVTATFPIGAA